MSSGPPGPCYLDLGRAQGSHAERRPRVHLQGLLGNAARTPRLQHFTVYGAGNRLISLQLGSWVLRSFVQIVPIELVLFP